jgi:hypothetical protein
MMRARSNAAAPRDAALLRGGAPPATLPALLLATLLATLLIGCAALPPAAAPDAAGADAAPLTMPDPARLRRSAADLPPAQVGAFTRAALRGGRDEATAHYRSGAAVIEMTVRRYESPHVAAAALDDWRRAATPAAQTTTHARGMTAWTDRAACGQAAETVICAVLLAPPDDAAPLQAFLAALRWSD